jgi:geranylgeranyl diphosphate synthase type I
LKILENFARDLNKEIEKILKQEFNSSKDSSPIIEEFISNIIENALAGGKRSRGAFVYYAYKACGGKDFKEIKKIASAMEFIHTFLLIHDDIQDNSDTRRGFKTIHKIYEDNKALQSSKLDKKHFGKSIAINAGDMLNLLSIKIINNAKFNPELKQKASDFLLRKIIDVTYGQTLDIFAANKKILTEKEILQIYEYKTAFYTYEAPLYLGAILANASKAHLKALSNYSYYGGIAFQIQDDIIGLYGKKSLIGKPNDSDILEGKKTLLFVKAFELAKKAQKNELSRILGNPKATKSDFKIFRDLIIQTGALAYCEGIVSEYLRKSTNSLAKIKDWEKSGYKFLVEINEYMANRQF